MLRAAVTAVRLHKCVHCRQWIWKTTPEFWSHIVWSHRYGGWLNKGRKCVVVWPFPIEVATPTKATYPFLVPENPHR